MGIEYPRACRGWLVSIVLLCSAGHCFGQYTHQIDGYAGDVVPSSAVQFHACSFSSSSDLSQSCANSSAYAVGGSDTQTLSDTAVTLAAIDRFGIHIYVQDSIELYGFGDCCGYRIPTVSEADAAYRDTLTFSQYLGNFGYMNLRQHNEGSVDGSSESVFGVLTSTLSISQQSGSGVQRSTCQLTNAGICSTTLLVDFRSHVTIDATATGTAGAAVVPNPDGTCCLFSGGVQTINFSDTSFLSDITFTDLNGDPITVAYTTGSGFDYSVAAAVPEPATWMLLSAGMLLVARSRSQQTRTRSRT
jgi:PEP-CTERM motif-containing protein